MGTVIKRVESYFEEIPLTGAICGNGHHDPCAKEETQCRICKDRMDPVLPGLSDLKLVKGYTTVRCKCNRSVTCSGFTTTCDCGCEYNWNGELLAARSEWGEETNEFYCDKIIPISRV